MKTKIILDIVLREMCAYGEGWRYDWHDFDGRTLRHQLNGLAKWAERAINQDAFDYSEGTDFLKAQTE